MIKHLAPIILMAAAAIPVFAADPHELTANIPFHFTAGAKTFQPGDYVVTRNLTGVIKISSVDRTNSAFLISTPVIASTVPKTGLLVFHRSGERYFLWEVWEPGNNSGSEVPPSKAEGERQSRSGVPARARVSVALR